MQSDADLKVAQQLSNLTNANVSKTGQDRYREPYVGQHKMKCGIKKCNNK